jgi:hypothetical protein
VLEVSLAPPTIADEVIDEGRGCFLVGPFDVPSEPDLPALANHQSRFDEIVTKDPTAEGFPAGECGELAKF